MIPDNRIVDTTKFTNENKRPPPKISGASEMKCLKLGIFVEIMKDSHNID